MATFHNGPLNGQTYTASVAAGVASAFNTEFSPDHYDRGPDGDYYYNVGGGSSVPQATPFPSEKQLYLAWSRLQRQYGVHRMASIRRSAAARARIRRGVR